MTAIKPIKEFESDNVFEDGRYRLLKSAVLYGANASGKSNFIDGLNFLKWFVINSSKETQVEDEIEVEPFLLDELLENQPSTFEVSFLIDGVKYRYGVELNSKKVGGEYLMKSTKIKEHPLFIRDEEGIEVFKEFKEGRLLEEKTRENALFLSVVAQFNGPISGQIIKWFRSYNVISGLLDHRYEGFTAGLFAKESLKKRIIDLMSYADLGIAEMEVTDFIISDDTLPKDMPEELKKSILSETEGKTGYNIDTFHQKFDKNGKDQGLVRFDFEDQESEGTKKFFRLAGPVLDTLENGRVLIIDELDSRLRC